MSTARRLLAVFSVILFSFSAVAPVSAAPISDKSDQAVFAAANKYQVAGRWIAFVKPGTSRGAVSALATTSIRALGATPKVARGANWFAFAGSDAVASKVAALSGVTRVVRDLKFSAKAWPDTTQTPNDTAYEQLWGIADMHVEDAWAHTIGTGVTVAVVDTGLKASHPDIAGASFANGYDVVGGLAMPVSQKAYWPDSSSIPHGTHVAGTIAAVGDNDMGVVGVAPGATLMPVRVIDSTGSGTLSDVTYGIEWAGDNGADVINLSIGGTFYAEAYDLLMEMMGPAIDGAIADGAVVVAASGNFGVDETAEGLTTWPAAHPKVIRVGAHQQNDPVVDTDDLDGDGDVDEEITERTMAWFSNAAPTMTVSAAGVSVLSTEGTSGWYERWNGTSMATPHVAGLVALIRAEHPTWSAAKIKALLAATASDSAFADFDAGYMGYMEGRDDSSGAGAVDAAAVFDVLAGGGEAVSLEMTNHERRVMFKSGPTIPVRAYAFGGGATCAYTVTVYDADGEMAGEGALAGTTCGARSLHYDGVTTAAGVEIPDNEHGWTVAVTVANGDASSTVNMSAYGIDTVATTVSAWSDGSWPDRLPDLDGPSFEPQLTFADGFYRGMSPRLDASLTMTFSGGQTRSFSSLQKLLADDGSYYQSFEDLLSWEGSYYYEEDGSGGITGAVSLSWYALQAIEGVVLNALVARDCDYDEESGEIIGECLWTTVDPTTSKLRLRFSDGTTSVSSRLLTVRHLNEADVTAASPDYNWMKSGEPVGEIVSAGCADWEDETCGDNAATGGAIYNDWLVTETSGATYTLTGRGGRLILYGSTGPAFGAFKVYVDGVLLATVDLTKNPANGNTVSKIVNGVVLIDRTFAAGQHTITLVTVNAKLVGIDAFHFGPR